MLYNRFCLLLLAALTTGGLACSRRSDTTPLRPSGLSGEQLARTHCGSCHQFPQPALLPKSVWQGGVLPRMALRFGYGPLEQSPYFELKDTSERRRVLATGQFPAQPTIHADDWQALVTYYLQNAPAEELPPPRPAPVPVGPLPFTPALPATVEPLVTLARFDSSTGTVLAGTRRGMLYRLTARLRLIDSIRLPAPPVDVLRNPDGSLDVLTIGFMDPNDRAEGALLRVAADWRKPVQPRLGGLQRPVQLARADLNADGRPDLVICQFGHLTGRLSWFEALPDDTYREHVLDAAPGARRALVRDVNNDGRPDVLALLTQGDEQIAVYYHEPAGTFRKDVRLRFPPVYGSSDIELADMNGDGHPDIVYANGDNADYSYTPKPYHGLRIFLNDGQFRFRERWFFPLNGATRVLARDFDRDGDMDLAAIATFPDYTRTPAPNFVYLEQTSPGRFVPTTFQGSERGRWLLLEAGDADRDGDEDLLLGSFGVSITPAPASLTHHWQRPGSGLRLLRNEGRPATARTIPVRSYRRRE